MQQCTSTQKVSNPRRPLKKVHELLPDYEKVSESSQYWEVPQWIASIYGKDKNGTFNTRIEGKNPPPPTPVARNTNSEMEKHPKAQKKGK
ncbi:hypothetical protein O181_075436 [Austropuccinia psidii MF-1]|uniref:Uncharacterized protein n=1 Tax=Austropuccinia psidii MF-1 TaxID=1389203 RepID=A0A9Q3IA67_9BASI|nr:hypothetical protein [Austropuccinia psidii MF-1]